MKSTSGNLEIYTTYTTHAICVLGEDEVEDEGEGWEDEVEDEGAEEGEGEGDGVKVVIKTETNIFRQFHSPTFFMTQKTFVHFL
jgi:hypothetical protein